jgi:signal transduction histidine kinase/CheY-like chemotaxis protein
MDSLAPHNNKGEADARPSRPSRRKSIGAGILLFVLLLAGWAALADRLVHWVTQSDIDSFVLRSRDSADQVATNLARNLQDDVRQLGNLPEVFTEDAILRAPIMSDAKSDSPVQQAALQNADLRLNRLADQLGVDLIYLLDRDGKCVASSNFRASDSLVGVDLHTRQYFTSIENGGRGRQFGFGFATRAPGLFFAAAVRKDGVFYGGVVLKRSMRSLFRLTTRSGALLVDEYGVVVASTNERALWHYLPESSAAGLGGDFLQERYRLDALERLDIVPDQMESPVSLVHLFNDGVPSLMTARPIGDSGLRLVYFTPLPDLIALRGRGVIAFWLVFVSGSLILALVAGAVSYVLQTRHRVAAIRYSYQKLSALSRELAAEKETAQAADRAKSRFLATMSHELRTPFSGILGMVDVLRASDLPPPALEQIGLLERSARALLGLLNDILDFSKVDAGQLHVENVPFDLQPIIHDLGAIQRVVASAKGISLVVEGGGDRPLVGLGDPSRLRQILNNFLSNAIKFTALGQVTLNVETVGQHDARHLKISVADSGPGISADTKERLFQPFFQADASTTRKHGGTGLGLAISKKIAEAMGGRIGVDSEPGFGAIFWVETPFPETDLHPVNADMPSNALVAAVADHGEPKRILLADDDEVNRLVIGGMLRRGGHQVSFALDGREAVREVQDNDYDLVIMDMHMPEMDGIEATRAIRTLMSGRSQIPIIGLTADAIVENRPQYLAAGLTDLLTKPIGANDLIAVVRRYG